MKSLSPTELRRDIYSVLDRVIETGEAVEVLRNGHRVLLVAVGAPKRDIWEVPAGRASALMVSWEELESTSFEYAADDELFPLLAAEQ